MAVLLKNNATSRLASSISAAETSLAVTSGDGSKFPSPTAGQWFPLAVIKASGVLEIMRCTARSGDVLTVERGQEGTAAQAFTAGDRVELRLTKGVFDEINQRLVEMQEAIEKTEIGWSQQPIGAMVPIWDNLSGVTPPPTDQGYRYIKLTAGDAYNAGVLTSESVSGSAPNINATAVISMPGSPLNGRTVRLINTERRFLRPGSSGTTEESQNASHTHTATAGGSTHSHTFSATTSSAGAHNHAVPVGSYTGGNAPASITARDSWGNNPTSSAGAHTHSVSGTTSSNTHTHTITVTAHGGNEARPRNIGVTYYMRIK